MKVNSGAQEKASWKRLFVVILSLLHSYFFLPASRHNLVQAAEAADLPATVARPKRTHAKGPVQRWRKNRKLIVKKVLRGKASWYGFGFNGKKTASGDIFDQHKLTAAHKTLPLGSKAIVTNLRNGNSVEVEINDRGPYVGERVIDLSYAAAKELDFVKSGTAPVEIELVQDDRDRNRIEDHG